MENPLVVIAAPDRPLVGKKKIPLARLKQETFVVREQGFGIWVAMEHCFGNHGIELNAGM